MGELRFRVEETFSEMRSQLPCARRHKTFSINKTIAKKTLNLVQDVLDYYKRQNAN